MLGAESLHSPDKTGGFIETLPQGSCFCPQPQGINNY